MGVEVSEVSRKVGFLGAGNMTQMMIQAALKDDLCAPRDVGVTNRSQVKANRLAEEWGVTAFVSNEELVQAADVLVLAVKPQDLTELMEDIRHELQDTSGKKILSLAAGIRLETLKEMIPGEHLVARIMPNIGGRVGRGVVGFIPGEEWPVGSPMTEFAEKLIGSMGYVVEVEEGDELTALTVAAASGPGFILEIMEYWSEWLQDHGFDPKTADTIVRETFLGTAMVCDQTKMKFSDIQAHVVSKKGVTAAGLEGLREQEWDRVLRLGFEKASLRDRELGERR